MAASNLNLGKASGGVLNIQPADGTTNTSIVLPASGTVTTNEYVNSNNLGNGSTTFNGFGGTGFKNYIINGNFNIWQRGTSFTGLTNGSYSADRWVVFDSVGNVAYNCIRNAGVFDSGYGGTFTFTGGTGNKSIIQFIENVTKFPVGSTFTLSFEAFSSSNITISPVIQGVRGTWSLNTSVVSGSVSSITITPTKTKYSVTFSIPDWASVINSDWSTLNDTKLAVKFDIAAGVGIGTTINLGNVQFEKGSVATPFEQRPYGLELSLCQRYYETCYPAGIARGTNLGNTPFGALVWRTTSNGWFDSLISGQSWFRVPKRVTPTMAYWDGAGNSNKVTVLYGSHNINVNVGSPFNNLSTNGFYSDVNVNANSATVFAYWEASAEL